MSEYLPYSQPTIIETLEEPYQSEPESWTEDPNYDPGSEANAIAIEQFGDDIWRYEYALRTEFIHAYGCECKACMNMFLDHKQEYFDNTRVPDEDTGDLGPSLLSEQIKIHDRTW